MIMFGPLLPCVRIDRCWGWSLGRGGPVRHCGVKQMTECGESRDESKNIELGFLGKSEPLAEYSTAPSCNNPALA